MTCVLGMVVRREREIREFVETPFYRVLSTVEVNGQKLEGEWKAVEGSKYYASLLLYKENGFKKKETAEELIRYLKEEEPCMYRIESIEKKKKRRIHHCCLTWRNFRMNVPRGLKLVLTRHCGWYRNSMRRNWLLIRERMPECFQRLWQRKSIRI